MEYCDEEAAVGPKNPNEERSIQSRRDRLRHSVKLLLQEELGDLFESIELSNLTQPISGGHWAPGSSNTVLLPQRQHIKSERSSRTITKYSPSSGPQTSLPGVPAENHLPTLQYKRRITPLTEAEIKLNNEDRRALRKMWNRSEESDYIEDPWKGIWEKDVEGHRGLAQWECDPEKRKLLLYELVDALSAGSIHERYVKAGLRAVICWIALIGLRLDDLYLLHGSPGAADSEDVCDSPLTQIQVLIEYIWACNASRSATIGDVLTLCYRRHVLYQPDFDTDTEADRSILTVRAHVQAVRIAIYLLNILYKHEFPSSDEQDLDDAWVATVATVEANMRSETPEVPERDESFLTIGDLNLKDLQNIGQLQIRWTPYWDEHLEIVSNRLSNTLKLYWFCPILTRYFEAKSASSPDYKVM
ncbi:MAG: hypothetical protein Q9202_006127 [Teloschistes flavicans]